MVTDLEGAPIADANVVMQDASNFRKYLRSAKTDANGGTRFSQIPANGSYFLFATHSKQKEPLKHFHYFELEGSPSPNLAMLEVYRGIIFCHSLPTSIEQCVLEPISGLMPQKQKALRQISKERSVVFENVPSGKYEVKFQGPNGFDRVTSIHVRENTNVIDGGKFNHK